MLAEQVIKENAAPSASVGADAGQQLSNIHNNNISNPSAESNENLQELYRKLRRMNDPAFLPTVTMAELYDTVYESRPPVIEGLLQNGTYIFAGAPKVGKSFLMAQLAYHVATGQKLWDLKVHQGTVLYLALEDGYERLQRRMYRMFGVEGAEKLHFAICAKQLGNGLDTQLEKFVREHPDTRLIIIDTLQKVRELSGEAYSYRDDYQIIGQLKQLADKFGLCMLIVHHTRKSAANDEFDRISGTTGIYGCADGAFVLSKESRTDNAATLSVSGRDQPDQRIHLVRDEERLLWCFDHADKELWCFDHADKEPYREPPDPLLEKVAALVTEESPTWEGSATELISTLALDMQPNALAKQLNVKAGRLLSDFNVSYSNVRTKVGSHITLTLQR